MVVELHHNEARAAAEWAARACYGRLLARLISRLGDVSLAEDVLADAFASALESWPQKGVPNEPEAWLMRAARNKAIDVFRRNTTARRHSMEGVQFLEATFKTASADNPSVDRRLELMFLCAHPALPSSAHTALMLQTVLGLTAEEIAGATLESPAAVGQRLARAKRQLKESNVPFTLPPSHILKDRMGAVLSAIYAAYTSGWENVVGGADIFHGLAAEGEWLARAAVDLAPSDAEAKGLLAMILYCESRRAARRGSDGHYIPLDQQDSRLWDEGRIQEATRLLNQAAALRSPGRFQIEAAIQAVHAARRETGGTDWQMICDLYNVLLSISPSLGARLGQVAALLQTGNYLRARSLFDEITGTNISEYAPYWAVEARLLRAEGNLNEARACYERAAALTPDPASRDYLLSQMLEI